MAGTTEGLERELVQVVRTMEQLQKKYLGLLLEEEGEQQEEEHPQDTLDSYIALCTRY